MKGRHSLTIFFWIFEFAINGLHAAFQRGLELRFIDIQRVQIRHRLDVLPHILVMQPMPRIYPQPQFVRQRRRPLVPRQFLLPRPQCRRIRVAPGMEFHRLRSRLMRRLHLR